MSSKRAILLLFVTLAVQKAKGNENFLPELKSDVHQSPQPKMTKNIQLLPGLLREPAATRSLTESSTFNPDVLNKFLEEYANKIKHTTEENFNLHPYSETTDTASHDNTNNFGNFNNDDVKNTKPTENYDTQLPNFNEADLNDTVQRNKYLATNAQDDRSGWVALDAIPWSKSKISKWQSNPSTQTPWPEMNTWDTPNTIKPWYNRPKPSLNENSSRPPYGQDNSNYAQKWPPEISPWDKNSHRPSIDIITDNRPSNFPNNWDRNQIFNNKPNYPWNRFSNYNNNNNNNNNNHNGNNYFDWNHSMKYDNLENSASNQPEHNKRPSFSQYQYDQNHSLSQPNNADGQWILLSTNRGYSKTRQRSIKINALNSHNVNNTNTTNSSDQKDKPLPVVTSRRQVRLTVLPSINGVNTTISHGGLLEVENTFKTVEQSQKEYERSKMSKMPTIIRNRPFKNTMIGKPSKAAVFAAVGAGMLPVTMAMMIPMMLGRRKRSINDIPNLNYINKVF